MIFWGPPGTGKTYFAKAIATAIGAAITIVSGPELKSKWVGESLPYEEEVFVLLNSVPRRIAIGELVEHYANDDVRTWTALDDGTARLAPVTGFLKHKGPDYIDVLVTETGREVRVTGGHSLFVRNPDDTLGEVFAEQVVPGETRVAVPLRLVLPETTTKLNLMELLAGRDDVRVQGFDDGFAMPQPGNVAVQTATRRQPVTLAEFEQRATPADPHSLTLYCWHRNKTLPAVLPLSPELGEFFGLWVADGCFAETGVRLACHRNQADKIQAGVEKLFGHVTRYEKKASPNSVDLVINHTLLRHVMHDGLGMRDGSGRKRVPPFIFTAPKPVVAAFLRGYFSGDGTFSGKYVEATTTSRELAADVVTLLQYFGIAARIRTKPERTGSISYRVRFLWSKFLRTFADEIGFLDYDRQQKLRAYLDGMTFKRDVQTPERHITKDVLWDKIVEKRREPYTREHVYDLSVPGTERFIAGLGNVLVHNSEENLRQIFHKARQSAPSIIVFDELDSFATRRGSYTGSGVEHSMVNQLLTEMDGFHKDELVFVVGTTNFVESLDPALLRPGRFEFHLHIPYPDDADRREILKIYDRKMKLGMTDEAFDYAVRRTGETFMTNTGTAFSGDHLNALCRSVARIRLRDDITGPTTPKEIERGFTEYEEKVELSDKDAVMVATHEAGHFVCSLFCPHHPPPERVTIQSEMPWAPFYTGYKKDDIRKVGYSRAELFDRLCVLYGGIEAERLLIGDVSTGASGMGSPSGDLYRATQMAQMIVEVCGMSNMAAPLRVFRDEKGDREVMSGMQAEAIDRQVNTVIVESQARAAKILADHKDELLGIRDELVKVKTIEPARVAEIIAQVREKYAAEFAAADPKLTSSETTPLDKPAGKKTKPAAGEK
jgi:intein/homing endonuclease